MISFRPIRLQIRFVFAVLLTSSFAWSTPVRPTGNGVSMDGGGALEQTFLYMWTNLKDFITPCLADVACSGNSDSHQALLEISESQEKEMKDGGLRFSEDSHSNEIFQTQAQIGALISFNLWPLYSLHREFSPVQALDLLLEALAQHHPLVNSVIFEKTRENLKKFWNSRIQHWNLLKIGHPGISLMLIEQSEISFLASSGEGYSNIRPAFEAQLICSNQEKATLLKLKKAYWSNPELVTSQKIGLSLNGELLYGCVSSTAENPIRLISGQFKLTFGATVIDGTAQKFLESPAEFGVEAKMTEPKLQLFDLHSN